MVSLCCLMLLHLAAQADFVFSKNLTEAYQDAMALKMNASRSATQLERTQNPNNHLVLLIENYQDFLELFIEEDKTKYTSWKGRESERLAKLDKSDKKSPFYKFSKAEIMLQWALVKVKFGDYTSAALAVRKAYFLLEENSKEFPEFPLNYKSKATMQLIIGSIPDQYKWLAEMVGLYGDIEKGIKGFELGIQSLSKSKYAFMVPETRIYYALAELNFNKNKTKAWSIINSPDVVTNQNLLFTYAKASVARQTERNDLAIELLLNRPKGSEYLTFEFLDYLTGLVLLQKLDGRCVGYFNRFITNFKGKNYLKESAMKASWYYQIKGETAKAEVWLKKIKTIGSLDVDEDKYAQKEAEKGLQKNASLLESRVLFDGGYYQQAWEAINTINSNEIKDLEVKTELLYRKGRVLHEWGKADQAIFYYKQTIDQGGKLPLFYASNASLNLGYIYENKGNKPEALAAYKRCLTYKNHQYVNSINQKAKAGIARIEK